MDEIIKMKKINVNYLILIVNYLILIVFIIIQNLITIY